MIIVIPSNNELLTHTIIKLAPKKCISFIMPVYNKEKYLNRSISSIISQRLDCYEVIATNDRSTDNSLPILRRLQEIESRIHIYTTKANRGILNVRITGALLSSYHYIFHIDPDDELYPETFHEYLEYAIRMNTDHVAGEILSVRGKSKNIFEFKVVRDTLNHSEMYDLFKRCRINWNLFRLIKRNVYLPAIQILQEKYPIVLYYAEDELINGVMMNRRINYSFYKQVIYLYHEGLPDNSVSAKYNKTMADNEAQKLVRSIIQTFHPEYTKCKRTRRNRR